MTSNSDIDSIYGRDALVLYLQDVRDLEVMESLFKSKISEGEYNIELNRKKYLTSNQVEIPKESATSKVGTAIGKIFLIYFAISVILIILSVAFYFITSHNNTQINATDVIAMVISVAGMLITPIGLSLLIIWVIKKRKDTRNASVERALKHNIEDEERLRRNREAFLLQFEQPWAKRKEFLQNACKEIRGALEQDYALNIIPLQYRNLQAAIYLYDFMSTSRQPFAQALDHAQIDDGIRRIESKLNVIISQNEAQLKQLAQIRSNTDTLIQQGNAILAAQVATAYYASSAAAHARSIDAKMSNMQSYVQYGF